MYEEPIYVNHSAQPNPKPTQTCGLQLLPTAKWAGPGPNIWSVCSWDPLQNITITTCISQVEPKPKPNLNWCRLLGFAFPKAIESRTSPRTHAGWIHSRPKPDQLPRIITKLVNAELWKKKKKRKKMTYSWFLVLFTSVKMTNYLRMLAWLSFLFFIQYYRSSTMSEAMIRRPTIYCSAHIITSSL